ncbi:MAG: hypothetical protein IT305_25130 [Chloroflexi bacterium]|nr:hypothetical protein [Chloroflexota bacterium]
MQSFASAAAGAITLLLIFVIGWMAVFFAGAYVERKVSRKKPGGKAGIAVTDMFTWVWDYSNAIGIPTLLLGTTYLFWAMYLGPGLMAGPSLLVILLMSAAALLIGFAPSLRRR